MIMTLVFSLGAAGNLSSYFYVENKLLFRLTKKYLENYLLRYHFNYIPFAIVTLYCYNLIIPSIIYSLLKQIGSELN